MKKKLILIRLDKIGDLICTLPADQVIDHELYNITWVVQKGMGSVVELGSRKRTYVELDKNDPEGSAKVLRHLLKDLKPDIAISFQCPWWVNFELFRAGVPVRAGVKSQWHSFVFLNNSIRQKRSMAEKHELEYNLDLVYKTLDIKSSKLFHFFEITKPPTTETLHKHGLEPEKYVVVHPGMMGSALNWPQTEYIRYIHNLLNQNQSVVITGTDSDEMYLDQIKKEFVANHKVTWLQSKLNLSELVQILAYSHFVVAPSTGVAHLAAGVGARIKGIYSPVRVHHPIRWAPRGPHVEVFLPDEECPGNYKCLSGDCAKHPL